MPMCVESDRQKWKISSKAVRKFIFGGLHSDRAEIWSSEISPICSNLIAQSSTVAWLGMVSVLTSLENPDTKYWKVIIQRKKKKEREQIREKSAVLGDW
jgi:hypothetical protein